MLAVAVLIILHGVAGNEIAINAEQITSMRGDRTGDGDDRYFTEGVRCMINLADGKFVTVTETCEDVRRAIEAQRQR